MSQRRTSLECRIYSRIKRAMAGTLCAVPFLFATAVFAQAPPPLTGPNNAAVVNGIVEIDGAKFFPMGWFHVTHYGTVTDLNNTLNIISAAGFNTLIAGHLFSIDWGAFLDQAAQKGVHVSTEFAASFSTLQFLISNYGSKPAAFGWNLADDIDNCKHAHADIQTLYNYSRANNPRVLTTTSGYRAPTEPGCSPPVTSATYMDVVQVLAMERYPITYTNIRQVYESMRSTYDAAQAVNPKVAALMDVQAVNHNDALGNRFPTAQEGRNMTYQAIAAGAKGIWYYSFFPENPYGLAPALWNELKSLVPEIRITLAPALLNGTMTRVLNDSAGDRFATYWVYQNKVYVVVINTSTTTAKTYALAMPAGTTGPAVNLFPSRPGGMTFNGGTLSGTVQPLGVHVYLLNESQPPPSAPLGLRIN